MQKIIPVLWFAGQAEAAAKFYTSIFKNSKILKVARYDESGAKASGQPKGSVMTIAFKLNGQEFVALNGGPHFKINEAISFVVNCGTQLSRKWTSFGKSFQPADRKYSRLADRQVWIVVANRPHGPGRDVAGQRCSAIATGDEGDASNEED